MTPEQRAAITRYLHTGDHDLLRLEWPGDVATRSRQAAAELKGALLAEVSRRASRRPPPAPIAEVEDLAGFTRRKVEHAPPGGPRRAGCHNLDLRDRRGWRAGHVIRRDDATEDQAAVGVGNPAGRRSRWAWKRTRRSGFREGTKSPDAVRRVRTSCASLAARASTAASRASSPPASSAASKACGSNTGSPGTRSRCTTRRAASCASKPRCQDQRLQGPVDGVPQPQEPQPVTAGAGHQGPASPNQRDLPRQACDHAGHCAPARAVLRRRRRVLDEPAAAVRPRGPSGRDCAGARARHPPALGSGGMRGKTSVFSPSPTSPGSFRCHTATSSREASSVPSVSASMFAFGSPTLKRGACQVVAGHRSRAGVYGSGCLRLGGLGR